VAPGVVDQAPFGQAGVGRAEVVLGPLAGHGVRARRHPGDTLGEDLDRTAVEPERREGGDMAVTAVLA
jgi:hypothetical protein